MIVHLLRTNNQKNKSSIKFRIRQQLEHGFEGMVVNVLIYIVGRKDIERVSKVYLPRNNRITSEDWEKVCSTDYGVQVNDRHNPISVAIKIGLDNPHPVIRVRVLEGFAKVMDKSARKKLIPHLEREKQMDSGNVQTSHPWYIRSDV